MLVRTMHGDWRLTAPWYKLLLTAHIVASVGWLGIAVAKLGLALGAVRASDASHAQAQLLATQIVDGMFPPAAILTLVTGIVLGLATKWGVVQYTWVLVKLAITIAVPMTAVRFGDRLKQESLGLLSAGMAAVRQPGSARMLIVWLLAAHILMLAAATVLSVYKPWGKSWFGRRATRQQPPRVAVRA